MDYLFLYTLIDGKIGMAFCSSQSMSLDEARGKVHQALTEIKKFQVQKLNYLGSLNYEKMDHGILKQLTAFEKMDPVWIWSNEK